jgi:hypothetical protein
VGLSLNAVIFLKKFKRNRTLRPNVAVKTDSDLGQSPDIATMGMRRMLLIGK